MKGGPASPAPAPCSRTLGKAIRNLVREDVKSTMRKDHHESLDCFYIKA